LTRCLEVFLKVVEVYRMHASRGLTHEPFLEKRKTPAGRPNTKKGVCAILP
jgi:hypothetical protein